jgi:hypothetical protein
MSERARGLRSAFGSQRKPSRRSGASARRPTPVIRWAEIQPLESTEAHVCRGRAAPLGYLPLGACPDSVLVGAA